MNEASRRLEPVQLSCDICLREIPHTDSCYEQAGDYVLHFCGLECYRQWRESVQDERGQG